MRSDELVRTVERTIRERELFRDGERILVAVSGGADSVALLHLLCALAPARGYRIAAAHVNHGLRGEESDEDEAYVRQLAERLGTVCFVSRVNVHEALPRYGNNAQSAARALRFQALGESARRWEADAVAVAHHADDQAETVLMRLLRGTGLGGLAGIRYVNHVYGLKLVRPLLRIPKKELEDYCRRNGLNPRFDSSNLSRQYFRNRIRLDLMPYIMKFHSGAADALRRAAELAADEDDFLDSAARRKLAELAHESEGAVRMERGAFLASHVALQRRMIKIILSSLVSDEGAVSFAKIERIRDMAAAERPTTAEFRIDGAAVFRREYDKLEWALLREETGGLREISIDVARPGELPLPAIGGVLEWRLADAAAFSPDGQTDPYTAMFDADLCGGTWTVRPRRPGDKLKPFGFAGTKSIQDLFVDGKLPRRLRGVWPVLAGEDGRVLWVPGFRRSDFAPVTERTRTVLTMRLRLERDIV